VQAGWLSLDDDLYVVTNPLVRDGVRPDALLDAFRSSRGSLWIPLAWISHMLDVSAFGLDPAGHHLSSVILHALNAAVLYATLLGLTRAPGRSALVAALFAVHPLRVESVAWIAERKDLLAALFSFLAIDAYRRWTARPGGARYAAVCVLFAAALLSKPMAVTLPVLLLLLDYWPLARAERGVVRLVVEKLPLAALAAAAAAVTLAVAEANGLLADAHDPWARAGNALVSYVRYVGFTAWPTDLAVFYPFPTPWPVATIAASALALGATGIVAVLLRRRAPWLAVGYGWYLVGLLPVAGFVQAGAQGMADRFTYVPGIGLLIAVVWSGAAVVGGSLPLRATAAFTAGVALGTASVLTVEHLARWRDAETLYEHTLAVTEGNWLVHHNLGELRMRRGAVADAVSHFEQAIAIEPRYVSAAFALGVAYAAQGREADAIASYERALAIDPGHARAHNNLGALLLRQNRTDEAIGHFATALRADPTLASARRNFVRELGRQGVPAARIAEYVRVATQR